MPRNRLIAGLSALSVSLALGGCASTSRDPTALIPSDVRASVIAEDRMESGSISVQDMLARARDQEGGQGTPGQGALGQGAPGQGAPETTGSVVPGAPPASAPRPPPSASAALPEPAEPKAFFDITFDAAEDAPPAAVKEALARKIKAARLSAKTEVTILSGPGPGTTAFDQALLANRRARNVRSLLPEGWKASQVYNPDFPPDTVRIVLGPAP